MGERTLSPKSELISRWEHIVEWFVSAVFDFVVPDVCDSCGQRSGSGGAQEVQLSPAARFLARETTVRVFRLLHIANHPLCCRCLSRLQPLYQPRLIGVYGETDGFKWVETVSGDRFSKRLSTTRVSPPDSSPGHAGVTPLLVYSPFRMDDQSLEIIRLIKFSRRRSLAALAAGAMAHSLRPVCDAGSPVVLVPVPMHPTAQRRRGFNQAELLAAQIARRLPGGTVASDLRKTRRTRRQSVSLRKHRAENVRDVFRWDGDRLSGQSVVLVDDLVTSGSTVASCASEILAAGTDRIMAVCLATAL